MTCVLTISRPNTIGIFYADEYDSFAELEQYLEKRFERMADQGWQLSDLPGSDSFSGITEATHDEEADVMVFKWSQEVECEA
jgi:hypothetical protein